MRTLPPIIRDYLSAGKYTTVARNLTTKYGLRIDQAGILEREIMLLLMGIETPQEFAQALTEEARLDKKIVDGIALDVNEQVFIPLRNEEQRVGMGQASSSSVPETKKEMAIPAVETERKSFFNLENKIEPSASKLPTRVAPYVAPLPPKTALPPRPSATLGDVVRSVLLAPAKPLDSNRLLEDHEEPSPSFKTTEAPSPMPEKNPETSPVSVQGNEPRKFFGSRIIPNAVPVNLPGALPEVQVPVTSPRAELRIPLPIKTSEAPVPPSSSNKSYAVDPYREPLE